MREKHVEPLGPSNDAPLEVTQELVAMLYVLDSRLVEPMHPMFFDGLLSQTAPTDPELLAIWQSGAFAAELMLDKEWPCP